MLVGRMLVFLSKGFRALLLVLRKHVLSLFAPLPLAVQAFLGCSYNEKVDVYAWSHVVAEMLSLDVVSQTNICRAWRACLVKDCCIRICPVLCCLLLVFRLSPFITLHAFLGFAPAISHPVGLLDFLQSCCFHATSRVLSSSS